MMVRRISLLLFSLFLAFAAPAPAYADSKDSKKEKPVSDKDGKTAADEGPMIVTLWDCLKMSKKNHPASMAAKFKLISLR